jgi:hypothetical protein
MGNHALEEAEAQKLLNDERGCINIRLPVHKAIHAHFPRRGNGR